MVVTEISALLLDIYKVVNLVEIKIEISYMKCICILAVAGLISDL